MANADLLDAAGVTIEDVNGSDWEAVTEANRALTKVRRRRAERDRRRLASCRSSCRSGRRPTASTCSPRTARPPSSTTPRSSTRSSWAVGIYDDQGGFSAVKAFRDSADFFGEGNQFATNVLGAMPMEQWYINVLNDVSPDAPMAFDTVP